MTEHAQSTQIARYQRLLEISRDLASTLDLNDLLVRIVHAAAEITNAGAASILLYDHRKHELHFEVATNMDNPTLRGLVVPVESSIAGWIVTNAKPIIISNAEKDSRIFKTVGASTDMATTSLLGVPLITKDKVIGALEAINKRSGTFSEEDQSLLSVLSAQAAIAIENTRLFQQSDLIAELVHELRTPMASLNTAAHLLVREGISPEQHHRIVEMIQGEINRLSEMTTAFLDLSRLESGRAQFTLANFQLNDLLLDCVEMMRSRAEEKGLRIEMALQEALPLVSADQDKIKQVILNLLSNAVKYNRPGGCIRVQSQVTPKEIAFSVQDNGPGISPENMAHLFERFYRVPGTEKMAAGTGLGLSICKRIIDAHGGEIHVESTLNDGTTFRVTLPIEPKAEPNR